MTIFDLLGLAFIWLGVGFSVVGAIGMVRMPDLYCRLHAAGKVSTVGLAGLAMGAALILPGAAAKLIALAVFAVVTFPASTHAIAAAAHRGGVVPVTGDQLSQNAPITAPAESTPTA